MPNLIITNKCNQNCPYCFASNILTGKKNSLPVKEMNLANLKLVTSFLKKSKEKKVRLMGGEPTLHSKFREFINNILNEDFLIQIFTNGLFNQAISNFLLSKGNKISYSFNVNNLKTYSARRRKILETNLKNFSPTLFSIGSVISDCNFNTGYAINLIKRYNLNKTAIVFRLANPIAEEGNKHLFLENLRLVGKRLVEEIIKASENKIRTGLGCGFSKDMFLESEIKKMKKLKVINLKWGCNGNSGLFDIGTNLEVFRCLPLYSLEKRVIRDFNSIEETKKFLLKDIKKFKKPKFIKRGPCFAYNFFDTL